MKKSGIIFILLIIAAIAALGFYVFLKEPKKIKIENKNAGAVSAEENNPEEAKKEEPDKVAAEKNADNTAEEVDENKPETKEEAPVAEPVKSSEDNNAKKESSKLKIINKLVSWGYQSASGRKIDTIVIHSSYNALGGDEYDTDKLIKEYKEYGVAPHYLIDRKGNAYKLVEEKNIAYHAGESKVPDGRTNVNNFSIGIELINTKNDKYTADQYETLNKLIKDIKSRYKIKYTLGHNQIAPGRKDDPWNFEWEKI